MNDLVIKEIKETIEGIITSNRERSITKLDEIISRLPKEYSDIIYQSFTHKRVPKEYLLSSILFTVSTAIGLTFYMEVLSYKNYANLYYTIIGSRGDTKSEAMKIATVPLKDLDDIDYDEYKLRLKNCDLEVEEEPIRKQILIQNASIEAVHEKHSENPNSVGMCYDEIYSLVEKMGNSSSRDGVPFRTFFLEGYTNGHIDISRKTTKSFRIKETYPTLLGGIQHQFVPKLFANGNLESGFIDRQLFTPKLTNNTVLSRGHILPEVMSDYHKSIMNILAYKRQSELPEEPIKQFKIELTDDANNLLFEYTQKLINQQMKAEPIIKEYICKMQISIHKFCLLVHMMKNSMDSNFITVMNAESVELAITLNEFYFINFNIILEENLNSSNKLPSLEEIIKLAKKNGATQKDVAAITGLHKGTVSKRWNKDKNNPQQATFKKLKDAV